LRYGLNFFNSLFLCDLSMTKMELAHFSSSGVIDLVAVGSRPADATSICGHDEKTRSAVGLRKRFLAANEQDVVHQ